MQVYFYFDLIVSNNRRAIEIYDDEFLRIPLYTCIYHSQTERVLAFRRAQKYCQNQNWMPTFVEAIQETANFEDPPIRQISFLSKKRILF